MLPEGLTNICVIVYQRVDDTGADILGDTMGDGENEWSYVTNILEREKETTLNLEATSQGCL
jgi:hypothetical protein